MSWSHIVDAGVQLLDGVLITKNFVDFGETLIEGIDLGVSSGLLGGLLIFSGGRPFPLFF